MLGVAALPVIALVGVESKPLTLEEALKKRFPQYEVKSFTAYSPATEIPFTRMVKVSGMVESGKGWSVMIQDPSKSLPVEPVVEIVAREVARMERSYGRA